jgi:hypothetical protein
MSVRQTSVQPVVALRIVHVKEKGTQEIRRSKMSGMFLDSDPYKAWIVAEIIRKGVCRLRRMLKPWMEP